MTKEDTALGNAKEKTRPDKNCRLLRRATLTCASAQCALAPNFETRRTGPLPRTEIDTHLHVYLCSSVLPSARLRSELEKVGFRRNTLNGDASSTVTA